MISQFNNLPGIYVYKDDGNLTVLESIPGNVTLVVGTAPDGPIGQVYLVTDTAAAERVFDPNKTKQGTLVKGIYEAKESGAPYVAAFRLGATPAALDFVNGYTIITKKAKAGAGSEYKLYYTITDGVDTLRVLSADTGTILFDSAAGIDNGELLVYGNPVVQTGLTIGSASDLSLCPTFSSLKAFKETVGNIGASKDVVLVQTSKTFTTSDSGFKAGQLIQLSNAVTGADNGYYLVEYVTKSGATYTVTLGNKLDYTTVDAITESSSWSFAGEGAAKAQLKIRFIPANTGLNLTLNEKFAAYAKAYWELESAKIDEIIPTGIFLNENNVVDNEGKFTSAQLGYVAPETGDVLGKAYEFEHNQQIFFAFKNTFSSEDDNVATTVPTPYELGIDGFAAKAWMEKSHTFETALLCTDQAAIDAAEDDLTFSECNFGHQLATFLDGLSENDNEADGTIAVKLPKNFSKAGIALWLGKLPVAGTDGVITRSGSGLLGYKYMAGSLNVERGFFKTNNGYVDGTPVLDRNNMKVDIGRYLNVVATPLLMSSAYDGTSTGTLTPGAGVYGGFLMSLKANQPATNKKLRNNVREAISLAKKYQNALVGCNYIVFTSTPDNRVKVVDAPTAALPASDWYRRSNCKIVGVIVDRIREIADPYIGGLTSSTVRQALEDVLNNYLNTLQNPEDQYLIGGQIILKATPAMEIRGEAAAQLTLETAPEFRQLTIYVGLSKS